MAEVSVATSRSTNYIEVHVELVDHPKTKRLARLLQISPIYVQAHLVEMWKWVMAYAPGGDLTRFDALDIADGACWEGDPEAFVEALCSCGTGGGIGFLERTATGKLIVHDWHSGEFVRIPDENPRRWDDIRKTVSPLIFERDGLRCVYCRSAEGLTVDHRFPRARGGSNDPQNLVTACRYCNSSKGARTPEEWRAGR